MEYAVVAFRSREHTIRFSELLKRYGVNAEIVNTPKEAGVGCGLSVKVSITQLFAVRRALATGGGGSFAGIFSVKTVAGKRFVKSI